MINYLSKINYLSIKLITCQNKLIADQKLIDYMTVLLYYSYCWLSIHTRPITDAECYSVLDLRQLRFDENQSKPVLNSCIICECETIIESRTLAGKPRDGHFER